MYATTTLSVRSSSSSPSIFGIRKRRWRPPCSSRGLGLGSEHEQDDLTARGQRCRDRAAEPVGRDAQDLVRAADERHVGLLLVDVAAGPRHVLVVAAVVRQRDEAEITEVRGHVLGRLLEPGVAGLPPFVLGRRERVEPLLALLDRDGAAARLPILGERVRCREWGFLGGEAGHDGAGDEQGSGEREEALHRGRGQECGGGPAAPTDPAPGVLRPRRRDGERRRNRDTRARRDYGKIRRASRSQSVFSGWSSRGSTRWRRSSISGSGRRSSPSR